MTIERFLAIVNKVTAYHRHGNVIPKEALDMLCNAQIELETHVQNTSSNSEYMSALKVIDEYKQNTPEQVRSCLGVECFAKQRLNQRS